MGYITNYRITVVPQEICDEVERLIEERARYNPLAEGCRWYEHEAHCDEASRVTGAFIVLDGEGEEPGDIWRKAFSNGAKVWEWKLDATPPKVPEEIAARATRDATLTWTKRAAEAARKRAEEAKRIAEKAEADARAAEERAL